MKKTVHGAVSAPSRPTFRPDVQGLRAVAVAIVVLYHAGLSFEGGFVGVDVFFVLSGFVIMRGLAYELETSGGIDLKAFALRRIRRLLPAFALLLAVVLPLGLLFAPVDGFFPSGATALAALLFNANTYFHVTGDGYFSASAELNPLLHTWSLSVEEQFYLVFPASMLISWKLGNRLGVSGRRGVVFALLSAGLASLVISEVLAAGFVSMSFDAPWGRVNIDERVAFFSTPTRAWEFAAGALLGLVRPTRSARLASVASVAGLVLISACCFIYSSPGTVFPGIAAAIPVGATVALLWAGGSGPVGRVLASAPMQRIGDLSYGWYLWHWPLIVYARAMTVNTELDSPWIAGAAALLALIPAELSMRLLENPIRRAKTMAPQSIVRLGLACAVIPALLTLVSMTAWSTWHGDTLDDTNGPFALHLDALNGCDSNFNAGDSPPGSCAFEVDAPFGTVALVGDSNAGQLSEGLRDGMAIAGYDLEISTRSSCLFADMESVPAVSCGRAVEMTTQRLIDDGIEVVFVGHAGDTYVVDESFGILDDATGEMTFDPEEKRSALGAAMARSVAELTSAGIEVIVVQPVPRVGDWQPGACAALRWASGAGCPGGATADDLLAQREMMAPINRQIELAGGRILDVSGELCTETGCDVVVDDTYMYRDALHISVAASEALAEVLAAAVSDPAALTREPLPGEALPFTE